MASEKQVAANQRNAQHSTGPRDTSQTSRNATKHGLLAEGVTEHDWTQHEDMTKLLKQHYRPEGPIEYWLVDQIALHMVRLTRAAAMEAAYIAQQIQHNTVLGDSALEFMAIQALTLGQSEVPRQCSLTTQDINKLNESVGRYETAMGNRLFRALHELERLQLRRLGENVPAPAAGDLNIHADSAASAASVIPGA